MGIFFALQLCCVMNFQCKNAVHKSPNPKKMSRSLFDKNLFCVLKSVLQNLGYNSQYRFVCHWRIKNKMYHLNEITKQNQNQFQISKILPKSVFKLFIFTVFKYIKKLDGCQYGLIYKILYSFNSINKYSFSLKVPMYS